LVDKNINTVFKVATVVAFMTKKPIIMPISGTSMLCCSYLLMQQGPT